ncbi:hypothetical protein SRHO_G00111960 [Serrasalmus rhombeus]
MSGGLDAVLRHLSPVSQRSQRPTLIEVEEGAKLGATGERQLRWIFDGRGMNVSSQWNLASAWMPINTVDTEGPVSPPMDLYDVDM